MTARGGLFSTITISVAMLVELMCSIRPSLTLRLITCVPLERCPCHELSLEITPSSELSQRYVISSPSGSIVVLTKSIISSEKLPARTTSKDAFGISLNNSTGITHSLGSLMPSEAESVRSNESDVALAKERKPVPLVQSLTCTELPSQFHEQERVSFSGSYVPLRLYSTSLVIGEINSPHGERLGLVSTTIIGGWLDNSIVLVSSTQFPLSSHISIVIS